MCCKRLRTAGMQACSDYGTLPGNLMIMLWCPLA
jgi:hypothetical protein